MKIESEMKWVEISIDEMKHGDIVKNQYGFRFEITRVRDEEHDFVGPSQATHLDSPFKGKPASLYVTGSKFRKLIVTEVSTETNVTSKYRF